jgi:hypothetical protein
MKTLKKGSIIKGIDFSESFYGRIQSLAFLLSEIEEKEHLETILILLQTLDKAIEDQNLSEELDVISGE